MRSDIERARLELSRRTGVERKALLGQYFTPGRTAAFMAGLFPGAGGECRLLDAGAGIGSLSAAFLDRWRRGELAFKSVEVEAFEIDESLHPLLHGTLREFSHLPGFRCRLHQGDFVHAATRLLDDGLFGSEAHPGFTHSILNPPYKKISSSSAHRLALRRVGIETVNLYSAFVALAVALTVPGGQVVAIVPRSFCNGPYYQSFREFVLDRCAIRHIHLFGARDKAFRDDRVLQENVIIRLEKDGVPGQVSISTSEDDSFRDLEAREFSAERIVLPDDPSRFIHVPTSPGALVLEAASGVTSSLTSLGIEVSTGPVVDFRMSEWLCAMPQADSVPLLYPCHFRQGGVFWPLPESRKPNAILLREQTRKWLLPAGNYCVVRRFSSKEERRRVVAHVLTPADIGDSPLVGLENHLNVYHTRKRGIPETLARGICAYLNSQAVDEYFRRFSGHTQVNATDLRLLKYPSREALEELGRCVLSDRANPADAANAFLQRLIA